MENSSGYLFYEAGQAVAAVHLGLTVRNVCGNPALQPSDILVPRNDPKSRIILWLTGMAAEKKGVGRSDPLRRMRNRVRMRSLVESVIADLTGTPARRRSRARQLLNQAQDRANSICSRQYEAIKSVVEDLGKNGAVSGERVAELMAQARATTSRRPRANASLGPRIVASNKSKLRKT